MSLNARLARPLIAAALLGSLIPFGVPRAGDIEPLKVAVIKAATGLCKRGETCHKDRAGSWTPKKAIAILAVSVAEQADIDLYTDIEVSTRPEMYQCAGDDSKGCIFRAKYAGPGLFDYGSTSGSTYIGSNITNTNITFPSGYGLMVPAGEPIYVHLDVRNGSLIDLQVDQDAWIYYVESD
ncbi:hypothetical protein [Allochromatium tepidum]|uniref:Uncharacterized protein n=1 Tax=Allochromatium tepidum TaxID=553982 RepID=A0ABN6GCL0_9GAMM|nr:hypothetical protein [Allochromatium tepidum]BCU07695.1 hypothetical protein Atep_23720 [Allochromatium tepidum]